MADRYGNKKRVRLPFDVAWWRQRATGRVLGASPTLNEYLPIIFAMALVGLFVFFAYLGYRQEQRRREAFRALSRRLGLAYRPNKDRGLPRRLHFLSDIRSGDNPYARHILKGDYRGHHTLVFEYHYQTTTQDSKGRKQTHHHYSRHALIDDARHYPELRIYPESLLSQR